MASSISAGTTSSTALVATADTSGALELKTNNGTTAVTVDTSQNVGIGTASPNGRLQVTAAAGSQTGVYLGNQTAGARTDLHVWSASNADGYIFFERSGASENGYIRYSQSSDFMAFQTASAERMRIDSSGNLQFNSGYGSVATAYGCRAWVNFNGTGTVAIRASGNVSSITDNGTGNYTANFTTAMPDTNFGVALTAGSAGTVGTVAYEGNAGVSPVRTTSSVRFETGSNATATLVDDPTVNVIIFR